jgi:hypothetical protein
VIWMEQNISKVVYDTLLQFRIFVEIDSYHVKGMEELHMTSLE